MFSFGEQIQKISVYKVNKLLDLLIVFWDQV